MTSILVVDDEELVRGALSATFARRGYEVLTASDGTQALALLAEQPVSLILSDQRMPGMSGIELFSALRQRWPDCPRLLLTAHADVKIALDAINEGWVHRFITKPWSTTHLLQTVEEVIEHFDLLRENQRLVALTKQQNGELRRLNAQLERRVQARTAELETLYAQVKRNMLGSVQMFSALLENYNAALGSHSTRVAALARELATQLGLSAELIEQIELAARLHDVGLICLPESIAAADELRLHNLHEPDRLLFRRHPEYGQRIVSENEQFTEVGAMIRAHHERYDGCGYPDHLLGAAIPLGARILAIVSQYDRIAFPAGAAGGEARAPQRQEALGYLHAQRGRGLDPELTQAFLKLLGGCEQAGAAVEVKLAELRVGMVLAEGIATGRGFQVLSPGTTLQQFHLLRLESFHRIDPITQKIFVQAPGRTHRSWAEDN